MTFPPSLLILCEVDVMENIKQQVGSLKIPRGMRIQCVALLFIPFWLSGCGMLMSRYVIEDPYIEQVSTTRIYSGTALDISGLGADNVALFALVDLPLSLIADTVFLPVTVYEEFFSGQLQKAASNGDISAVTAMLDKGADINARNVWGYTALMSAAWSGHTAMVQMLINKGADVNAKHIHKGATALSYANKKVHTDIRRILLDSGGGSANSQ
jgi:uncharacterized protein YceK